MKVSGPWLEASACQGVLALLEAGGHQAYVVGGAVRDAVLSRDVGDVDIATDARPERVKALAEQAKYRCIPTGIDHGTVTLVRRGQSYEVTTFRQDVETDGRRAVVAFSDDIETDAMRRDFTMNALYVRADGTVVDPLEGLPDLLARRVRFINDPVDRIKEDALRILRFFRFYAHFGDVDQGVDADGLAACAEHADLLDGLSAERIGHEMRKLLSARDPGPALASMGASGVLAHVAPGAQPALIPPLVDTEGDAPPDWMRRFAAMGLRADAVNWRFSNAESKALGQLRAALEADMPVAELAYRYGAQSARNATLIMASVLGTPVPDNLEAQITRGAAADLPIRAADLLETYGQGPALGKKFNDLKERWIASDFRLSKAELLKL